MTAKLGGLAALVLACNPVGQPISTGGASNDGAGSGGEGSETATSESAGDGGAGPWVPVPGEDVDGDGAAVETDCNDFHAAVYPGAPEVFDGFDNDCDEAIDEDGVDQPAFGGYGRTAVGGAGGTVVRVSTLADSGAGSLREALDNAQGATIVEFDVAGEIVVESKLRVARPFITINGASAPSPGVTLRVGEAGGLEIGGTHDIIITHLRFVGPYEVGAIDPTNVPGLSVDGDTNPDGQASRIVVDHVTIEGTLGGGPDVWGTVRDLTVSYCMVSNSFSGSSVSFFGIEPYQTLQRMSWHHNAYIGNETHNPQLRADVRQFDFLNNVVTDWGQGATGDGRGFWIRIGDGEPTTSANIVGNYFASDFRPEFAIVYGDDPGPADDNGPAEPPTQGQVVTSSRLGQVWVADNRLPDGVLDRYSTVSESTLAVGADAVPVFPTETLRAATLAWVGVRDRTDAEAARLAATAPTL